jgi:tetratricopeptide (TPR) repeat protein
MGVFRTSLGRSVRRRVGKLLVLALLGVAAVVAVPHLRAWYHLHAAVPALNQYHVSEARDHLDVCLRVWPNNVRAHLLAARAARLAGDFEAAEQQGHLCQQLEKRQSDAVVLEWALLRASMGDLGEVEDYLQTRLAKDPANAPLIWEALATGYLRMYRILEALDCLESWLKYQPDNAQALVLRGDLWKTLRSFARAVPDYERALALDPERHEVHRRLGLCLQELTRLDEAVVQLEAARRWQSNDTEVQVRLARCYSLLGRKAQARQLLDDVLAQRPEDGRALKVRGQLALLEGRPAEAEDWLRRAVKTLPNDYQAGWALADALGRQPNKYAEARVQLARAEKLKALWEEMGDITHRKMSARPNDPALHCRLGVLLLDLGYTDLGERWLLSALNQDRDYRPAHAALADFYEAQKDADNAAYHRRQAKNPVAHKPKA